MPPTTVHIGAGAGFAGDRPGAAVAVAEALAVAAQQGIPAFLIFEMLAERTLALAQLDRRRDPDAGYSANMPALVGPVLKLCLQHNIRIVGNFGAAHPMAAARRLRAMAEELGFANAKIAVVQGDDLSARLTSADLAARETDGTLLAGRTDIVAANAYLGAQPIAEALGAGAQIVVTGRVADPSLALGPLAHVFGWRWNDWDRLAAGTLVGHLLECGPQVSGGYFADPGLKDAPDLDRLGYPIAEVKADGSAVISKPDGSGGAVNLRTVKEQILYEIHNPAAYLTPDVILDLTEVELAEQGPDRLSVTGARGHARPETLKATVCFESGWFAEAEISYAGPNATARARLAIDIIRKRMAAQQPGLAVRADIIGVVSSFGDSAGSDLADAIVESDDIRVRFATRHADAEVANLLLAEVEALYVAGPAGGGGVRRHLVPQLASASCLIERDLVTPQVDLAP
ncbi:acyclic terpene utilization AtuA family protein [Ferrovibrio sp.]|uniref:acyclic terpene utilization AtuA family protein n=1 Tax=Ferrovibrio sp. TaxID=1917215 RepID=UPI0025C4F6FF|nr:acyclic terpene utilization AtuA family protein [Ferrovibrio sp.]